MGSKYLISWKRYINLGSFFPSLFAASSPSYALNACLVHLNMTMQIKLYQFNHRELVMYYQSKERAANLGCA